MCCGRIDEADLQPVGRRDRRVSRRALLTGGVGVLGLTLAGCTNPESVLRESSVLSSDVSGQVVGRPSGCPEVFIPAQDAIQLPSLQIERRQTLQGQAVFDFHQVFSFFDVFVEKNTLTDLPAELLTLQVINQSGNVARLQGARRNVLEQVWNPTGLGADGIVSLPLTLVGLVGGQLQLLAGWKFTILCEGACAIAIDGVYAGCALGGQLNATCVCNTLASLPAPGSWACKACPATFRAAWAAWGCAGPSPF